ncbi:DUF4292 domain-containing protein [Aquimarina hainanensis]|uniref:DUF4292 domain-containing protein n=1 Tax=Aquimarina hainanensis TaxID=1578017 RepID=A0ABW5N5Y2_9FLAO|nr:DUF4292 domain-containing protein [Aquimarina sp. TRL1]QKX04745.1 DUF4292 domain-containing protein [Aquimarina sp. TRL1]
MKRILYVLCTIVFLLQSCKGTKAISDTGKVKKISAEKVIANHYNHSFNFKTLNARLKVRYSDGERSFSPNVTLRMEKDKTIWLSAKLLGITVAKALITPESFSYYEKGNHTYFEGDFKMLSKWLGADLNFDKVQQMLLGQALFNLREEKYKSAVVDKKYQLIPKKQLELFERLLFVNPDNYKMFSQQLSQGSKNLAINYVDYQRLANQSFPKEIYIVATNNEDNTTLKLEYKTVDYNAKVSFPFTIPAGYTQVTVQ